MRSFVEFVEVVEPLYTISQLELDSRYMHPTMFMIPGDCVFLKDPGSDAPSTQFWIVERHWRQSKERAGILGSETTVTLSIYVKRKPPRQVYVLQEEE